MAELTLNMHTSFSSTFILFLVRLGPTLVQKFLKDNGARRTMNDFMSLFLLFQWCWRGLPKFWAAVMVTQNIFLSHIFLMYIRLNFWWFWGELLFLDSQLSFSNSALIINISIQSQPRLGSFPILYDNTSQLPSLGIHAHIATFKKVEKEYKWQTTLSSSSIFISSNSSPTSIINDEMMECPNYILYFGQQ